MTCTVNLNYSSAFCNYKYIYMVIQCDSYSWTFVQICLGNCASCASMYLYMFMFHVLVHVSTFLCVSSTSAGCVKAYSNFVVQPGSHPSVRRVAGRLLR